MIAAVAADFPTDLKLTNGATLHSVSVVRWEKDRVILKHAGGIDPVRFDHIDAAQRATVLEIRDAEAKAKTEQPAIPTAAQAVNVIEGQAFIATRGAGNYKIGGMTIYAFPIDRIRVLDSTSTVDLGEPIATTKTDADGKFKLKLPNSEDYFLFAHGTRIAGSIQEDYEWTVKSSEITDRTNVLLENSNHTVPTRSVKIGDVTFPAPAFSVRFR